MRLFFTALVILFFLILYGPTILLPIFAFNDSSVVAFPLSGFTLNWFEELIANGALKQSAVNSLIIASITAIVSTCLAMFASRASTAYKFRGQNAAMGLVMIPLVLPEIIVGVSLLVVILQLGLPLSLWTIILGHVLICTPFCIAILRGSFQQLDPSLEEASLDLGQSRLNTFVLVTLPLLMPSVISSLLIAFIISLDEFVIAFFLSGTEPTLPVYIWSQLRFPQKIPSVMALGTVLLVLSIVLLSLSEYQRRRSAHKIGTLTREDI